MTGLGKYAWSGCAIVVVLMCCGFVLAVPVQFTGLRQTYSGSFNSVTSSALADMTQDGVVAGAGHFTPLPHTLSDITKDPAGSYYGTIGQDVYRINPTTFQFTQLPITGVGNVDTGWDIGCTFDTLRNRLIVATLSGPGYIFAYSPQTQQWSLLSEFNNEDFQSIVYRPGNDTLYTLRNPGGSPIDRLFKYGPNGQLLGTVPLQYAIPEAQSLGDGNYQLMVTSDPSTMAILTPPLTDSHDPSHPLRERLYLVNADTGAITYNAVFPAPEPTAGALIGVVLLLATRRSRSR